MSTETTIHYNGSKCYGEPPDSIEKLIEILGRWQLDRTSGMFREGFITPFPFGDGTRALFFGNFRRLSHVFRIETDDPGVIARLTAAIAANDQIAHDPVAAFYGARVKDGPHAGMYDNKAGEWIERRPARKRRGAPSMVRSITMERMQSLANQGIVSVY